MKHLKLLFYFSLFSVILTITSCRKKDERYEGYYIGTERYTYTDSGATVPSIDTTYEQALDLTYEKHMYTGLMQFNGPHNQFAFSCKSIEDHMHQPWNSPGYIKFVGDSIYMTYSNWTDAYEVYDSETWYFAGKR